MRSRRPEQVLQEVKAMAEKTKLSAERNLKLARNNSERETAKAKIETAKTAIRYINDQANIMRNEMRAASKIADTIATRVVSPQYCFYSDTHSDFIAFFIPLYLKVKKASVTLVLDGDSAEAKYLYPVPKIDFSSARTVSGLLNQIRDPIIFNITRALFNKEDKHYILLHGNHDVKNIFPVQEAYTKVIIVNAQYQLLVQHGLMENQYMYSLLHETETVTLPNGDKMYTWKANLSGIRDPNSIAEAKYRLTMEHGRGYVFNQNDFEYNNDEVQNFLTCPGFLSVISRQRDYEYPAPIISFENRLAASINDVCAREHIEHKNPMFIFGHDSGYPAFAYHINYYREIYGNNITLPFDDENSISDQVIRGETYGIRLNDNARATLRANGFPMLARVYGLDGTTIEKHAGFRGGYVPGENKAIVFVIIVSIVLVAIVIAVVLIVKKMKPEKFRSFVT